ncbi:Membrane-associating domain family protein [Candida parapsilosis]|uniref:MARVEL domain-containing protein n=2 Tax=Candida parapsilosis TaxID=5480 RepID=G8BB73_CANPC|nr:uncharacterized protein CPAR2_808460 [Candida parapsilosis]KAF6052191.1 Membrane-associating domain family protein [Candida parapsilosis]KAF6052312.1 Membrane-associating domain family protein [Candida parapsilosis]KAF6053993.1 Membrane-associating domain family protein [Candida parapsilosis]KAF6064088.1 Membrane-associating domain family protein [Candida parapsilosis]KAI5902654.1 hypothetical protein K4G60_g1797 [Candida parapsilosis]
MAITRTTISIIFRLAEFVFAVIVLGLSAGVLAGYNTNIPRVTFNLVVAIFDIIWLAYIAFIVPSVLRNKTPTAVVFAVQVVLWVFYLAGWSVIVANFPKHCNNNESFYKHNSPDTCRAYQAIMPFSILNYVVLSTEWGLFYSYTLAPEMKAFGGKHLLQNTTYYAGALFSAEVSSDPQHCVGNGAGKERGGGGDATPTSRDEEAGVGTTRNDVKM